MDEKNCLNAYTLENGYWLKREFGIKFLSKRTATLESSVKSARFTNHVLSFIFAIGHLHD